MHGVLELYDNHETVNRSVSDSNLTWLYKSTCKYFGTFLASNKLGPVPPGVRGQIEGTPNSDGIPVHKIHLQVPELWQFFR